MQELKAFTDKLKDILPVSLIIGRKVNLKRYGKLYKGLCPFHQEDTPSFTINDDKQFYYCFGCGEHGDIIEFIIKTQGVNYIEAVKILADEASLSMPSLPHNEAKGKQADILYEVHNLAAKWFGDHLYSEARVKDYLRLRGIGSKSIEEFTLGYFPGHLSLYDYLKKKGISASMQEEAGLILRKEDGQIYERFRARLIFPIKNRRGEIIAFGGRILENDKKAAKYINSPETAIFSKRHNLYGIERVKRDSKLIIVEGYMDVIALTMAGINYAVAPLGTAFTDEHLVHIWSLNKNPYICFDNDKSGIKATSRIAMQSFAHLKTGYSLSFVNLTGGKDPDEIISKRGKEYMTHLIAEATDLPAKIWELYFSSDKLSSPEKKAILEKELYNLAKTIPDPILQQSYKEYFRDKLWHIYRELRPQANNIKKEKLSATNLVDLPASSMLSLEQGIVALIVKYPQLLENNEILDQLMHIEFTDEKLSLFLSKFIEARANQSELNIDKNLIPLYNSLQRSKLHNETEIVQEWYLLYEKYQLTLMQNELNNLLLNGDEASMKRMEQLGKLIREKQKFIKSIKSLFTDRNN